MKLCLLLGAIPTKLFNYANLISDYGNLHTRTRTWTTKLTASRANCPHFTARNNELSCHLLMVADSKWRRMENNFSVAWYRIIFQKIKLPLIAQMYQTKNLTIWKNFKWWSDVTASIQTGVMIALLLFSCFLSFGLPTQNTVTGYESNVAPLDYFGLAFAGMTSCFPFVVQAHPARTGHYSAVTIHYRWAIL